jgi:predicted peptidase
MKMFSKMALSILLALVCLVFQNMIQAQDHHLYEKENFVNGGDTLPYRIMFPINFEDDNQYPLLIFLHGSGERGSDNENQLVHGGSFFAADSNRLNFPAIVVFPQCSASSYWANVDFSLLPDGSDELHFDPEGEPTLSMQLLILMIDSLRDLSFVDNKRIYIGGLSMGGMGTFELLYRMPEVFAAAFPICGGGNAKTINEQVRYVKVWAFHGEDDTVVLPGLSEKMIEALIKAGADARLTIYPNVGHNAWDYVFREPSLLPWLFEAAE